jgi:hypothetical protein
VDLPLRGLARSLAVKLTPAHPRDLLRATRGAFHTPTAVTAPSTGSASRTSEPSQTQKLEKTNWSTASTGGA